MVLMMVDQGYDRPPDLQRDPFWDEEVEPLYSEETAKIPNNPLKGSVSDIKWVRRPMSSRMSLDCRSPCRRSRWSRTATTATRSFRILRQ